MDAAGGGSPGHGAFHLIVRAKPSIIHRQAAAVTQDAATLSALAEARANQGACLALQGAAPSGGSGARARRTRLAPEQVFGYLRNNRDSGSDEIALELDTDAASLRPALHTIRDEGRIRVDGEARQRSTRRGGGRRCRKPDARSAVGERLLASRRRAAATGAWAKKPASHPTVAAGAH
jgi:hypothetical protein